MKAMYEKADFIPKRTKWEQSFSSSYYTGVNYLVEYSDGVKLRKS
jgi:hypothetical protein